MTAPRPMLLTPLALVVATSALAALAAWREPQGAIAFLAAMLFLPVAWSLIELRQRARERTPEWLDDMKTIRWSISAAALMMVIPLGITLAISYELTAMLEEDLEKRIMGIIFGVIFLFYGNVSAKRPVSLSTSKATPEQRQAQTRFAGRIFVLTGLAYTLVWTFAPINWALPVAMAVLIGGVGLVMIRYFLLRHR